MKCIYESGNPADIALLRSRLDALGIPSVVLNAGMSAVRGEVPMLRSLPQVWVHSEHETPARGVVEQHERGAETGAPPPPAWTCPTCGESREGQFDSCWRCGPFDAPPDTEDAADSTDPRKDGGAKCGSCGYPLWGLSGDRCPECGEAF